MLKRIRTTPLPASAYLSGVLGSTAATTLAITACIVAIGAFAFGAVPRASGLPELAGGLVLGVVCFGALGLALSSVARSAESAAPIANASYLPMAIMSGIFDPTFSVPRWLSAVVGLLPVRALAQILAAGLHPGRPRLPGRPVRPARLDRGRLRVRRLALPLALKVKINFSSSRTDRALRLVPSPLNPVGYPTISEAWARPALRADTATRLAPGCQAASWIVGMRANSATRLSPSVGQPKSTRTSLGM